MTDYDDDYDDGEFEQVAQDEESESEICSCCSGSGEGQYDGQRCWYCKGKGEV